MRRTSLFSWLFVAVGAGCSTSSPGVRADVSARGADASDIASERVDARVDASMDAPDGPRPALVVLTDRDRDNRVVVMEQMMASIEMQQSGEPLAESMGRDLTGFDRFMLPTDMYDDPMDDGPPVRDLAGFSTGVESYEYSKMHMNMLALESTAGTSLAHAPLVNPTGLTGAPMVELLRQRVQRYAVQSHAGVRAAPGAPPSGFVTVPAPTDNPLNALGFGGVWPTVHPFRAFDPTIAASRGSTRGCSLTGGYGASAGIAQLVGDYECGYSTLHLTTSRGDSLSIERVVSPGASGWSAWKYSLWVINYLQIMHDSTGAALESVPEAQLGAVGREGNTLVGVLQGGGAGEPGAWIGSSDIEGFQAAFMIEQMDAAAHQWITALSTTDGASLSGFASVADALAYDYTSPLRWLPTEIRYDEERDLTHGYHRPVRYAVGRASSRAIDLLGLLGAYGSLFAVTDRNNAEVGGAQTARVYFDGEPFASDNLMPDGEGTLHDRALAVMKLALVDLDRAHRDPATGYLVDDVTFSGSTPTRSDTVSALTAAQAVIALRVARRSLASRLTLYSNSTPDTAVTRTALDGTSLRGVPGGDTVAQRITALINAQADLLLNRLSTEQGVAYPGYALATRQPTATDGDLDAYAAVVRGLLEASLATGDTRYQTRAERVFQRMESQFFSGSLRAWRQRATDAAVVFTPLRFGLLQSALREMYKLVGSAPGREPLGRQLERHIARLNKLVLNGWDDRDEDDAVDWPEECVFRVGNQPRGGLQMAERALTGETGVVAGEDGGLVVTDDRDHDCVPELSAVNLPAALAAQVRFTVQMR